MLDNQTRIENLKESKFQELFGVNRDTFFKLLSVLEKAFAELYRHGGKSPKLSVLDKLVITLCYYREYRTMQLSRLIIVSSKAPLATRYIGLKAF